MIGGLFTASTAMDAFQTSLATTANNLANVNTTAFKRSAVNFQDLIYTGPDNLQVGHGVRISDTQQDIKQGTIQVTDQELDLSVNGNGYFSVQLSDGTTHYTRDGSFKKDALGRLVTSQGYLVQPPITFPADTISTSISTSGVVSVVTASAPTQIKVLGQIQLTNFSNPAGLEAEANNLYQESPNSGAPVTGVAGTNGLGTIKQHSLEQSNVDMTTEIANLVTSQQAFSANSQVLVTSSQVLQSSLNLVT